VAEDAPTQGANRASPRTLRRYERGKLRSGLPEPPYTERYVRWWGMTEGATSPPTQFEKGELQNTNDQILKLVIKEIKKRDITYYNMVGKGLAALSGGEHDFQRCIRRNLPRQVPAGALPTLRPEVSLPSEIRGNGSVLQL
jgi:hypothetical protein